VATLSLHAARVGGVDIEHVHQARVATRRLRSDLRTFRSLLDASWATDLRVQLEWLADLLGRLRDCDVLVARLNADLARLEPADRLAGEALVVLARAEQVEARDEVVAAMQSDRYRALTEALVAAADAPRLSSKASRAAAPVMASLVRKSFTRLDRAGGDLSTPPLDDELHVVRISAKRVRYAADAAEPVWGKRARRLAAAMTRVQSVLGELQDAVVMDQWLRRSAWASVASAFVAGELVEMQNTAMAASRAEFPEVWRRASAPKLRAWLR
jgi:CHAD domain-containing protein